MKHFFIFSFLLMSLVSQSQDYAGTDFRFAFMKNLNPTFNLPPTFDISIEAMEDAEVVVRFGAPENIGAIAMHSFPLKTKEAILCVF